ncbi:MAG: hypothetical protein R3F20_00605 [Planctomycetota bacterium]
MPATTLRLALIALVALTFGCGSTGSSGGGRAAARSDESTGAAPIDPNAEAVYNSIRDCRVILYQPKTRAFMIMVNRDHEKRATETGRLDLALGRRSGGYNVLSDRQIDAVLETLKSRGGDLLRTPFTREDERYLQAGPDSIPHYKGIIVIENGGERWKYLGVAPQNDPLLAEKYRIFSDLKLAVATYYGGTGPMEQPSAGGTGAGNTSQLNVPTPTRVPTER